MTVAWPDEGTRKLQEHFAAAGFGIQDWWFRECALFNKEEPSRLLKSFRAASDDRVKRKIALGQSGQVDDWFASMMEKFNKSFVLGPEPAIGPTDAIFRMKREEANRFGIAEDISFAERRDFIDFAVAAAEAQSFRSTKLKRHNVGPVLSTTLGSGDSLIFYFTPPRSWSDWSAHQSFCEILPAGATDQVAAFNLDALMPGLGAYRVYRSWRECALSALAMTHAHRSLADILG